MKARVFSALVLGTTVVVACDQVTRSVTPFAPSSRPMPAGVASNALVSGLLPPGLAVPEGQPLFGSPTPPNRAKGEVVRLHDARNDHTVPAPKAAYELRRRGAGNAPSAGDGDQGLLMAFNSPSFPTLYGVMYNAEVGLSRSLPAALHGSQSLTYAPTLMPPHSCIEGTIISSRLLPDTGPQHLFGFEDQCTTGSPWQPWITMDATFQGKYVRTMSGKSVMTYLIETSSAITSPQCWFLDVYNYTA